MSELYFYDFMKSALYSICEWFKYLFSWDKEFADEENPSTWENTKDNNKTLSDALRAFAEAAEEFAKVFRAWDLFASERTVKPRAKFTPCLKLESHYNYIPVVKRNMPYQRRSY